MQVSHFQSFGLTDRIRPTTFTSSSDYLFESVILNPPFDEQSFCWQTTRISLSFTLHVHNLHSTFTQYRKGTISIHNLRSNFENAYAGRHHRKGRSNCLRIKLACNVFFPSFLLFLLQILKSISLS